MTDEKHDGEFDAEPEEPSDMHETKDPNPTHHERKDPIIATFDLNGPSTNKPNLIEPDDLEVKPSSLMLRWHHRLSHMSMRRIQMMAQNGQLPKSLATCRVPMCQACQYGKATRHPWRSKATKVNKEESTTITKPGQCVSVDQLESITPGFFA
jgi:GAG-pre-integrase domain